MKKRILLSSLIGSVAAGTAYAASGPAVDGGMGLLPALFIGFLVVLVSTQMLPSLVLFVSMLKGIFGRTSSHIN